MHGVGVGCVDIHVSHDRTLKSATLGGQAVCSSSQKATNCVDDSYASTDVNYETTTMAAVFLPEFQQRVGGATGTAVVGRFESGQRKI